MNKQLAVVLLSGGLDSATVAMIARSTHRIAALSFDYGQRHRYELIAAKRVAEFVGAESHQVFPINLNLIGGSALTDKIAVPMDRPLADMSKDIPATYVPGRNIIFLSIALAWAEVEGAETIYIGANSLDYSGYPDCRPEFLDAYREMAELGTKRGVEGNPIRIAAPLIRDTKAQIIKRGMNLGMDYSITSSCYSPDVEGLACGRCDSCLLRKKGFMEAGVPDPTHYVRQP